MSGYGDVRVGERFLIMSPSLHTVKLVIFLIEKEVIDKEISSRMITLPQEGDRRRDHHGDFARFESETSNPRMT